MGNIMYNTSIVSFRWNFSFCSLVLPLINSQHDWKKYIYIHSSWLTHMIERYLYNTHYLMMVVFFNMLCKQKPLVSLNVNYKLYKQRISLHCIYYRKGFLINIYFKALTCYFNKVKTSLNKTLKIFSSEWFYSDLLLLKNTFIFKAYLVQRIVIITEELHSSGLLTEFLNLIFTIDNIKYAYILGIWRVSPCVWSYSFLHIC